MSVTAADVAAARERIAGQIVATPCLRSQTLSEITGAELWLKFENLQYTASFKERGALNRLAQLTPAQAAAGVIAMSAGNHAQGVATTCPASRSRAASTSASETVTETAAAARAPAARRARAWRSCSGSLGRKRP